MRGPWSTATLALAVLSLPAPTFAAAEAAPPATFGEQIDIRAVDVFAAVTDRSGHRVIDLSGTSEGVLEQQRRELFAIEPGDAEAPPPVPTALER